MDTPSRLSRFAKILYDDINNGCGSRRFSPSEWKKHFYEEHEESAKKLTDMLEIAYIQYALSRSDRKSTL